MAGREKSGLEHVYDGMQWFKLLCAALCAVGLGVVLLVRPEPIPDFPYRELAGYASTGFGGLMLFAAFFGNTAAGKRVKCLLVGVALGCFAGMFGFVGGKPAWDGWRLAQHGVETSAVVTDSRRTIDHSRRFRTRITLEFDGHRANMMHAAGEGDVIAVVYLPEEPNVVARTEPGTDFWSLWTTRTGGPWQAVGFTALGLVFGLMSLAYFWGALVGPSADMVE